MEGCEGAGEGFLNTGTEWSLKVNILRLHLADVFCPNRETHGPRVFPSFPPTLQLWTPSQFSRISRGERKQLLLSIVSLSVL